MESGLHAKEIGMGTTAENLELSILTLHFLFTLNLYISEKYEDVINAAIREWTQYTCLAFVPANDEIFELLGHTNYVLFNGVSDSIG